MTSKPPRDPAAMVLLAAGAICLIAARSVENVGNTALQGVLLLLGAALCVTALLRVRGSRTKDD